ncbi:hypothetical protein Asi02nite_12600 [Asanoa siamensis]|uniref:HEAT repeat protein n=2 Tax=Asanoa siamensis TaxID=926357 RepID=A0ABQ4CKD7_9ACTN|nr:hypothetical protein Asi02nite_12600 [Asanoa siamensis]
MHRRDPQLVEDGFQRLRAIAGDHVDRLIAEFRQEPDHDTRCRLLELIAEARSERAFDLLASQLETGDEALRDCAARGLRLLDTDAARALLTNAPAPRP